MLFPRIERAGKVAPLSIIGLAQMPWTDTTGQSNFGRLDMPA